jgi:uncharacterized cupredoxin-like copper-binding protein
MARSRGKLLLLLCGVFVLGAIGPSIAAEQNVAAEHKVAAENIVKVSLWDRGPHSLDAFGNGMMRGMGMGMGTKDMPMAMLGITAEPGSVKAGRVTFEVTNSSKDMIHEMVVSPVADPSKPLPYDKSLAKVDEDAAGHLGEVSELSPGQSGSLSLSLKPGTYILYCNVPGHYALGMWTLITVTPQSARQIHS